MTFYITWKNGDTNGISHWMAQNEKAALRAYRSQYPKRVIVNVMMSA